MYSILYLVRADPDFERAVALAISGKEKFNQKFIFAGDSFPLFSGGVNNQFQKYLFKKHGFEIKDFCDYDFIGWILKKFSLKKDVDFHTILRSNRKLFLPIMVLFILKGYLKLRNKKIVNKLLKRNKPDVLLTDQSVTREDYTPEIFRKTALRMGIPSCLYTHGAAAGLHHEFCELKFDAYKNYYVFACSDKETYPEYSNRIVTGDMASSFPYVNYIHSIDKHRLSFLDDRKYRIAFFKAGFVSSFTSTNAWLVMEEIIIDLSERLDVAMVVKKHPRKGNTADYRMLYTFNNVKFVESECDRSRVVQWANIVVCSDHCSTIFEPMILGKKVVAIEGKRVPRHKDKHSPLKHSSIKHISCASEFDLDSIPNANPEDPIINQVCWGNHEKVDLAKLSLEKVEKIVNGV